MMIKNLFVPNLLTPVVTLALSLFLSASASAELKSDKPEEKLLDGYQLLYVEREPGVDDYDVTMLISDRYIRVDDGNDKSGYIVYDDKEKIIYSVSNVEKSVLVINEHAFSETDSPVKSEVEYLQLADAPTVSGKEIYNYRVHVEDEEETTCLEVQLVENILPDARVLLQNYQAVISGQQVKLTDNKISEEQTACYFVDQIYNRGAYYEKGLPIQEWHSNERSKILTSYKRVHVDTDKFIIPEKFKKFSVDKNSKTFIK